MISTVPASAFGLPGACATGGLVQSRTVCAGMKLVESSVASVAAPSAGVSQWAKSLARGRTWSNSMRALVAPVSEDHRKDGVIARVLRGVPGLFRRYPKARA